MTETPYAVVFSNMIGCALGISDISLVIRVHASSESDARSRAIDEAKRVNRTSGLPPHGIRVSDEELERLVVLVSEAADDST